MLKVSHGKPFGQAKDKKGQSKRRFVTFHDLPAVTGIMALAMVFIYPSLDGSRSRLRQKPAPRSGVSNFHLLDAILPAEPDSESDEYAPENDFDPTQPTLDNILMDIQLERSYRSERVARAYSRSKSCRKRARYGHSKSNSPDPNEPPNW